MRSSFFSTTLALILTLVLIAPSAFLIAPQKTYAQLTTTLPQGVGQGFSTPLNSTLNVTSGGGSKLSVPGTELTTSNPQFGSGLSSGPQPSCVGTLVAALTAVGIEFSTSNSGTPHGASPGDLVLGAGMCLTSAISLIEQTISTSAQVTGTAALVAMQIDAYVLQPLAFVLSGKLLKVITEGVIAFVIGKANGTGIPQFVADIQVSLQTVSDVHTLAYLDQYMRSSRSPYSGSIVSALRKEYLNKTSLAGFWAANMDTLRATSPNPYGYLNGNWALGGVDAWFALTTQIQNNPYTLYQSAQNQLANIIGPGVGGATGARLLDINNGQGFVSWCGSSDGMLGALTTNSAAGVNAAAVDASASTAYDFAYNKAIEQGRSKPAAEEEAKSAQVAEKAAATARAKAANAGNSFLGISPGDPCTNADGTTGTIKTPGSVIAAGLNKVLGGQQDSVVRMGNVGPEINKILGNIATVLKTVDFAAKILGGPGSGGLFGVNQPSGSNMNSLLRQYTESPGNFGVTNSNVSATAATLTISGPEMLNRVAQYESAINTIRIAANTTSTNIADLVNFCIAQQQIASSTLSGTDLMNFASTSAAQINAAQTALATEVTPVLSQVATASSTIAAARAMVQKVQTQLNPNAEGESTYIADMQTLQTMAPTPIDVANAQQSALKTGTQATASPPGSLNISGPILIDRLELISTNATALKGSVCTAPAPIPLVPPPTPTP